MNSTESEGTDVPALSGARLWELAITSLRCQTSLLAGQNKWPQSQVVGGPVIPAYPPIHEGTHGTSEAFAMQATDPTCLKPIHQKGREGKSTSETNTVGVSCQCLEAEGSSYQVHCLLDPEAGSPRPSCGRAGSPEAALFLSKDESSPVFPLCVSPDGSGPHLQLCLALSTPVRTPLPDEAECYDSVRS